MNEGYTMNPDVERGYELWRAQVTDNLLYFNYYYGNQPMQYTYARLYDVFGRSDVKFTQNWCAVVVDAVLDRLGFKGWDGNKLEVSQELFKLYTNHKIKTLSRRVHRDCVVTGNGFIMFDMVDGVVRPFYNDPDSIIAVYSSEDLYKMAYALKIWKTKDMIKLNIYYDDIIQKYECYDEQINTVNNFKFVNDIPNPFGVIPIVHFRSDIVELINIIPLQDAINKIFADMMVVGEFAAFPQRWIITNADISTLKNNPQSIMQIPKGPVDEEETKIGSFITARLGAYLEAIDRISGAIAVISRTPKHYFMQTGANVSGEALSVMEIPLVKKAQQYQEIMDEGWMQVLSFLYGTTEDITTVWSKIEVEMMEITADAIKTQVEAGIPLVTILRRMGWSDDEVAQMEADKKDMMKNISEQEDKDVNKNDVQNNQK